MPAPKPDKASFRAIGLEPWLFALLWTAAGFFFLFLVLVSAGSEPLRDVRREYDLAVLQKLRESPAAVKVVLMGNSMLRYATLPDARLGELAANRGLNAAFARLLSNNALFNQFDYAFDELLDLRPDLIVVQAPVLIQEPANSTERLEFFRQYIRWRLIGGTLQGEDPHEVQHELVCHRDVSSQMHHRYRDRIEQRRKYAADGTNARAAAAFIERAGAVGIPVIAVTVPATERLTAYFESNGDAGMIRAHALPRAADSWIFVGAVSDDLFCDPMHLAPEGRRMYSAWLLDRLQEWHREHQEPSRDDPSPALNIIANS